jgi:formylmethanofuran dehydrogenase subunit E
MTPDQEDELSIIAARDLDDPEACSFCGEVRTVKALLPDGGKPLCSCCWEAREIDES